jgi:predicted transcriptional regulator
MPEFPAPIEDHEEAERIILVMLADKARCVDTIAYVLGWPSYKVIKKLNLMAKYRLILRTTEREVGYWALFKF